jgi:hypothetical protein
MFESSSTRISFNKILLIATTSPVLLFKPLYTTANPPLPMHSMISYGPTMEPETLSDLSNGLKSSDEIAGIDV